MRNLLHLTACRLHDANTLRRGTVGKLTLQRTSRRTVGGWARRRLA